MSLLNLSLVVRFPSIDKVKNITYLRLFLDVQQNRWQLLYVFMNSVCALSQLLQGFVSNPCTCKVGTSLSSLAFVAPKSESRDKAHPLFKFTPTISLHQKYTSVMFTFSLLGTWATLKYCSMSHIKFLRSLTFWMPTKGLGSEILMLLACPLAWFEENTYVQTGHCNTATSSRTKFKEVRVFVL